MCYKREKLKSSDQLFYITVALEHIRRKMGRYSNIRLYIFLVTLFLFGACLTYIHVYNSNNDIILATYSQKQRLTHTDADILLIPSDEMLQNMTSDDLFLLYGRYTSTFQVFCRNVQRVGSVFDGGKEVCVDSMVKPRPPCLVYSFGSNNIVDFEEHVLQFFKCTIHIFDPSTPGQTINFAAKGFKFHEIGLAEINEVNSKNWQMHTLETIVKKLNHTQQTLDILKMDIEYGEWRTLDQMMESGALNHVKQLFIEFHIAYYDQARNLAVLRRLYEFGFRTFSRERNIFCGIGCFTHINDTNVDIARLIEISYSNINFL